MFFGDRGGVLPEQRPAEPGLGVARLEARPCTRRATGAGPAIPHKFRDGSFPPKDHYRGSARRGLTEGEEKAKSSQGLRSLREALELVTQSRLAGGIGKVHRIPPVGLKCVSEKRRREMTALVGGGTKAVADRRKIGGLCRLRFLTSM